VTGGDSSVSGSNVVKELSSYTFEYDLTAASGNLKSTDDYLIVRFPSNYFDKNGDFSSTTVKIDSVDCTFFRILAQSNEIFLRPNSDINDGTTIEIEIGNLPNPSYSVSEEVSIIV
jgi:hypothetical protein